MAVPTGNLTRWLTVAKLGTAALVAFALLLPLRPLWHPAVSALDTWDDAIFFLRYAEVFHHTGVLAWNPGDMATYGATAQLYQWLIVALWPWADGAVVLLAGSTIPASLTFVVVLWTLWSRGGQRSHLERLAVVAVAAVLAIGSSLPRLADTGMDANGAALYVAVWAAWWLGPCPRRATRVRMALCGMAFIGTGWLVRPDMAALTFGAALVSAVWPRRDDLTTPTANRSARAFIVGGVLGLVIAWLGLWRVYGTPVPPSFWVKTWATNPYGPEFAQPRRLLALRQVPVWLRRDGLALVLAVWLTLRLRPRSPQFVGSLFAVLGLTAYFSLAVVPLMQQQCRFYAPFWPVLVLVAGHAWYARTRAVPKRLVYPLVVALVVMLGVVVRRVFTPVPPSRSQVTAQIDARPPGTSILAASFVPGASWQAWPGADHLARVPLTCAVATTELGRVSQVIGLRPIVDLAGLIDRQVAQHGIDIAQFMAEPPALVWFKEQNYHAHLRPLVADPAFLARYLIIPAAQLGAIYNVAILREGPCALPLREALDEAQRAYRALDSSRPLQ